jgi:flagellar hook-length control protein FliK
MINQLKSGDIKSQSNLPEGTEDRQAANKNLGEKDIAGKFKDLLANIFSGAHVSAPEFNYIHEAIEVKKEVEKKAKDEASVKAEEEQVVAKESSNQPDQIKEEKVQKNEVAELIVPESTALIVAQATPVQVTPIEEIQLENVAPEIVSQQAPAEVIVADAVTKLKLQSNPIKHSEAVSAEEFVAVTEEAGVQEASAKVQQFQAQSNVQMSTGEEVAEKVIAQNPAAQKEELGTDNEDLNKNAQPQVKLAPQVDTAENSVLANKSAEVGVSAPTAKQNFQSAINVQAGEAARSIQGNSASQSSSLSNSKDSIDLNALRIKGASTEGVAREAVAGNEKSSARGSLTGKVSKSDQEKIIDRVQEMLKKIRETQSGNSLTVKLEPDTLGAITVKITQRGGDLFARIVSDKPEVEATIKDQISQLQQALSSIGFKSERVHILVSSPSSENAGSFFDSLLNRGEEQSKNFSQQNSPQFSQGSFAGDKSHSVAIGKALAKSEENGWVA